MSYSFGIYFKNVKDAGEVLEFYETLCSLFRKNSHDHIANNIYYAPSVKGREDTSDKHWVQSLFSNFHVVYWKDQNLLGLSGFSYPVEIECLFDTHICFQNSSDQDYEFEYWGDKIPLFVDCVKKYGSLSAEEILATRKELDKDYWGDDDIDDIKENLQYYQRTLVYETIYRSLHLNDWLYGKENETFVKHTLNAINSLEEKFKIESQLNKVIKEKEGEDYER